MKWPLAIKHIGLNAKGKDVFFQYADRCLYTERKYRESYNAAHENYLILSAWGCYIKYILVVS